MAKERQNTEEKRELSELTAQKGGKAERCKMVATTGESV